MRIYCANILVVTLLILVISGCSREQPNSPPEPQANLQMAPAPTHAQPATEPAPSSGVAGIQWKVPEGWQTQPPRSMRVATYSITAAPGDTEKGECAVFFFGTGQGGDVRSNISRWISQFEGASQPEESTKDIDGIKVTTVTLTGTYLAPSGPMMQSQDKKSNYRLLGAIVEAPQGAVFFKMTGPAATISAAEKDFAAMIDSIERVST